MPDEPACVGVFLLAALVLSLERICYAWIWLAPESFRAMCAQFVVGEMAEPIDVLGTLFVEFKLLQGAVFIGWCVVFGRGSVWPPDADVPALALGVALIAFGQLLNVMVFRRLGEDGVFYGRRLGYQTPWCREFPFSVFEHPQYIGALLSIWGFFLVMRFPHGDWLVLPLLETAYYMIGARLER